MCIVRTYAVQNKACTAHFDQTKRGAGLASLTPEILVSVGSEFYLLEIVIYNRYVLRL